SPRSMREISPCASPTTRPGATRPSSNSLTGVDPLKNSAQIGQPGFWRHAIVPGHPVDCAVKAGAKVHSGEIVPAADGKPIHGLGTGLNLTVSDFHAPGVDRGHLCGLTPKGETGALEGELPLIVESIF